MLLLELLQDLDYRCLEGELELEITDIIYDSRKVKEGTAFVCITGTQLDSHTFLPDAVAAGAKAVIVEHPVKVAAGITVILVENTREALAKLSAAYFGYPAKKMITIGITGTKGKTTTTYMVKAMLEAAGRKVGLIGTNGAVIDKVPYPTMHTTPESYQIQDYFSKMAQAGCEYLVMEVSSQGLMMHRVDGFQFDYGIFANISPDHIGPGEHQDFEEYLYYKRKLLSRCRIGLVNKDDKHYEEIVKGHTCELFTYGIEKDSDFHVADIQYVASETFVGVEFQIEGHYSIDMKVNVPGRFNVYNALAAASLCSFLSLSKEKIGPSLEHLVVDGRMEIVHISSRCTVLVDYAHNAISMESLLSTLREYHPKRLVCVFGCGGNRSRLRRFDMGEIGGNMADLCIITADNSRFEKVEDILEDIKIGLGKTSGIYVEIPDRREAIAYSITSAQPGDMIVIIGKGHEDYQEIEGVRYPFLDKAVAKDVLSSL